MQPSDCLILMALNAGKIIENISHQIYFLALKFREKHFRPGLSPGPAGKAYDALLVDPLIGWGRGTSSFRHLSCLKLVPRSIRSSQ